VPIGTNFAAWFSGGTRDRELRETRDAWEETEALWRKSPLGSTEISDTVRALVREAMDDAERTPATPVLVALCEATDELLRAEDIIALEAEWHEIESDVAVANNFRAMLTRRRQWASDYDRMFGIARRQLQYAYQRIFEALPDGCFADWDQGGESFEVPLIELLEDPAEISQ
jgi:hypothetical protein